MLRQRRCCPIIALSIGGLFLGGLSNVTWAQPQEGSAPSVAEAARRAREQKKNAAKPVRTFTNDDLPPAPPTASSRGSAEGTPADPAESVAPAASEESATSAKPESEQQGKKTKAEYATALERAKEKLAQAEKELDVMQRKAALDNDAYYSKPDFANDKDGKANLDAEAQQINDKKQAVDAIKARVAELQALVGEVPLTESDKNPPPR
jgi:hypothetical protein